MEQSSNNQRIAKNTIFLYVRMILVLIVSIYTTRVILNNLGVVDYGIYNVVAGFVSMFAFLNSTMTIGIQRFYNYTKGSQDLFTQIDVYNTALYVQIIISLIIFVLLESFGVWYINNVMVIPLDRLSAAHYVFQCSILSLVLVVMQIPYSAAIMANERMDYFALVSIVDVTLKLIIVIILPYVPFDKLLFYGFLSLGVGIIDFSCYFFYCRFNFKELRFDLSRKNSLLKQMLSFSGWNVLDMFAYTVKGQGLNLLLNVFFGPSVNAARGISSQIMAAIQGFSSNIVTAFRPQLVESYAKKNYVRTRNMMFSMSKLSYILLYILCIPVVIEIDQILNIWLNGIVPAYTKIFTILVLANMLVSSLNTPLSQVVQATGVLRNYQIVRSIIITSILPLSWIALKCGANATSVFVISLALVCINQPISMILLHKIFNYSYFSYCKEVILPCFIITISAPILPFFLSFFLAPTFIRLIIITIVSIIFSSVMVYVFGLSNVEKEIITNFINKKL